ncbi:helix-turn-helix transcriptional regulator [Jiangella alkaliphila]
MKGTSARMLALLSLMQSRPAWTGSELAERLGVSARTIRNDVDRLRELGYPVDAARGAGGHYRLGAGARLPPLLLDDEEAVAVAIGLRAGNGVAGIEESSARALAKLEQVLPHRLRRQVTAIGDAMSRGPENTGSNVEDPVIDAAVLTTLAAAIRDHEAVRFDYRGAPADGPPLSVEPYRLVSWQRHWYLVGRDPAAGTWRPYRVDWISLRMRTGLRFEPAPLPGEDYTAFVLREVASTGWSVHARITVCAPAADVLARINPTVGVVESVDESTSVLVTGADSLEIIAVYIGMLGLDFRVTDPPELVEHVRVLGERYRRAIPPAPAADG